MEVTVGFEPTHNGFADRRLNQLGYVTSYSKLYQRELEISSLCIGNLVELYKAK